MRLPAAALLSCTAGLALAFAPACGGDTVRKVRPPPEIPEPACGDALVTEGEDCDGSNLNEQSCTTLGFDFGTLTCDGQCRFATGSCVKLCGNGTLEPGEQCDGTLGPLGCDGWGYKRCNESCQVEGLNCRTTPFVAGTSLQLTAGGEAVLTDLAPAGYGDLVTAVHSFGRLQTHDWKPAQGFEPDRTISRVDGKTPYSPIAGDLDGDGRGDVAATNLDGSADRYRYTPAAGGQSAKFVVEPLTPAPGATTCEVGPWLGAGKILGGAADDLAVLACPGATGSITWDGVYIFPGGAQPGEAVLVAQPMMRHAALGDVNGDGRPDLLLSLNGGDVKLRLAPAFEEATGDFATDLDALALAVGDLDGDGDGDLIAVIGGELVLFENLGNGLAERRRLPGTGYLLVARDLDLDGRVDLAWLQGEAIEVRRNVGNFTFTAHTLPTGPGIPLSLAVGDLEGDGDPDLVATHRPSVASEATVNYVYVNQVR